MKIFIELLTGAVIFWAGMAVHAYLSGPCR